MRKVIVAFIILGLSGGVYAGTASEQLDSATAAGAAKVQSPEVSAPKDATSAFCRDNPMAPGCPKYCHTVGWGSPICPPPLYCGTNPNGYGCPKSAGEKSADEVLFDPGLAKASCASNPNAPGCPLFCKDHHAYPGCPLYCQSNPMSSACGHVPAYCGTNPNGYNCPKSAGDKSVGEEAFDEGLAKANCASYPAAPGCPLFCKDHHAYPGCPQYCQLNPMSPACRKSVEGADAATDETGDMKKVTPGYPKPPHPQYCQSHHGLPSCR